MTSSFHFAPTRRTFGRNVRFSGVAIVILIVGVQAGDGADSTVRVLGTPRNVQPTVSEDAGGRETIGRRDSIVKRESIVRVATATSSVLGRQESKLIKQSEADVTNTAGQPETFTQSLREAVALREAVNRPPAAAAAAQQNNTVATRTAPPATISALTLAKPAPATPAPAAIATTPAATTAVPIVRVPSPTDRAPASRRVEAAPMPLARIPAAVTAAEAASPITASPITASPITASPITASPITASPIIRNEIQTLPAPSPVVRAPEPPAAPSVASTPAPIAQEPVRVAQLPATVVPAPTTFVAAPLPAISVAAPAGSIAVSHATRHPHTAPAPPSNGIDALATCPTEGAPEEYDVSDALGCAYGPGQSGAQFVCGVDCGVYGAPCYAGWHSAHCIPWSLFGPGEYVGPSRTEHVSNYYLRVNDFLTLTYINSRQKMGERYRLGIGDRLLIESSVDESLRREVEIQPDGEITLPIVGEVLAAGKTVKELREDLVDVFKEAQREPQITITPVLINSGQQEIIRSVKAEIGSNGQALNLKVTPEGTIQVPGLGSVYVQGLTLEELRTELEARYAATFGPGLLISPALTERAISYVFIGGEVKKPGRYTLEGPTTATQAIAMAQSWNIGGNLHQVVVFRRDENWCLKAIKIDVRAPLYGNDPCPVNDVWLRDNDYVIVPKSKILCATDIINLYMTRGVYAAFPVSFFKDLSAGSSVDAVIPDGP